jgi:hypothetical protein
MPSTAAATSRGSAPLSTVASVSATPIDMNATKPSASKNLPVYVIERSPYESNGSGRMRRSAENGEEPFDRLLRLLDPKGAKILLDGEDSCSEEEEEEEDDDDEKSTSSSRAPLFDPELSVLLRGNGNAEIFVRAYRQIDRSGMCYSSEWIVSSGENSSTEPLAVEARTSFRLGASRSNNFSFIQLLPKPFLLLCLRPDRITKATDAVLREIITDLNCQAIVLTALIDLELGDEYENLRAAATPYYFHKARKACYKCVVFLARTVAVLQLFDRWKKKRTVVDASLMTKIRACMKILDDSVRVDPKIAATFQKGEEDELEEEVELPKVAKPSCKSSTIKKPPGRRSDSESGKKRKSAAIRAREVSDTTESSNVSGEGSESAAKDSKVSSISISVSQPATHRTVSSTIGDSLREQHERLGDVVEMLPHAELKAQHQSLGESIARLREEIQMNPAALREQWREEMRQELLQEMREKASNSRGKKKKHKKRH